MKDITYFFIFGALWMLGIFIIGTINNYFTNGKYALGIMVLIMGLWLIYVPILIINKE